MDAELLAVLTRYSLTGDPEADLTALGTLDRERLNMLDADLRAEVHALHQAVLAGDGTDDSLDAMRSAAEAVQVIGAEVTRRDHHTRTGADALAASLGTNTPPADTRGLPSLADLAARTRPRVAPRLRPAPRVVTASGRALDGPDEVASELAAAWNEWSSERDGGNATGVRFQKVVSIPTRDQSRRLSPDDVNGNDSLIASARAELDALVASGGFCAPTEALYDVLALGVDARPVRDALVRFVADRGGVRFTRAPTLAAVTAGTGVWTNTTDITPGGNTKALYTATCPATVEVFTQAVTQRVKFGNFTGRAYPEKVAATMSLLAAAHARTAENALLDQIAANSTVVTSTEQLGAARDLLHLWSQAAAAQRSRLRLGGTALLQLLVPAWVREVIRADLTYAPPGDQNLAVSDADIDAMLAARHLQAAWYEDSQTTGVSMIFGAQGTPSDLRNWPGTAVWYLFPPGSFLFLDGGTLDLGIVRDSTLNAVNDYESFYETWEAAAFVGAESLAVRSSICPNGQSAQSADTSSLCAAS